MRRGPSIVLLVVALGTAGCRDDEPTPAAGTVATTPLPPACQLVTEAEVARAVGAPVSEDRAASGPDRCRYLSERRDSIELTVDHPGFSGAVRSFRGLNPEAQPVEGVGDEAAVRLGDRTGEIVAVKGTARLFVVISGGSPTREALVELAGAAVQRL